MPTTPLEEVLSRLPIQGGSTVGGTSAYAAYLPVLNASGQLDSSFFASTILHVYTPANHTALLALVAHIGDIAIQQDTGSIYMYSAVSTWTVLGVTGGVPYVNTTTGLTATDVQAAIDELWAKTLSTNVARTTTALVTFNTGSAPFAVVGTTLVTNLNADLLDGQQGTYYLTANNLTGTLPTGVLGSGPYTTNIIGNVTGTATYATTAATATTSLACSGNAASATTAAACTGNAATATQATNALNLQAADSSFQPGSYFQNPANLTGGFIPNEVFDATSHGILTDPSLHAVATSIAAGFMSADDKAKLDTIEASASQPGNSFGNILVSGSTTLTAATSSDSVSFVSDTGSTLSITTDTGSGNAVHFGVTLAGLLHSELGQLYNPSDLTAYDDHLQYVAVANNRTITANHTFNPSSTNPPFYLGANAMGQLVTGFNAELLDGQYGSYYQNAAHMNAGVLPVGRLSGTYTINIAGTASGNVPLTGNSTISGDLTANNFIDAALIGTGNRLLYTTSTGKLLTDSTIITGLLATYTNSIVAGGTDLTTSLTGSTLTLNVTSATAATASKIVKRDSSGDIYAHSIWLFNATDSKYYQVYVAGGPAAVVLNPVGV